MFDVIAYRKKYYQKHKEKIKRQQQIWRDTNPTYRARAYKRQREWLLKHPRDKKVYNAYMRRYQRKRRVELRYKVLQILGEKCACCGESTTEFLTPDHVYGGGCQHLKRRGTDGIYLDILREGNPKDKYQTLCMNCNWAKSVYGSCPHGRTGRR